MGTLVMKFGGTSVGSAEAIRSTAEIVRAAQANWPRVVVVASAMSGVTDALLNGAHTAAAGDASTFRAIAQDLRARHFTALNDLVKQPEQSSVARATVEAYLGEFESLCHAVNVLGEASPRALDAIQFAGRAHEHSVDRGLFEIDRRRGGTDRVFRARGDRHAFSGR